MKLNPAFMQTFATLPKWDKRVPFIPPHITTYDLGFFCRQELKMQQAHIPVVFRVGSMEECNYLEQKPGYKYLDTK